MPSPRIHDLKERIDALQRELEEAITDWRREIGLSLTEGQLRLNAELKAAQRRLRRRLLPYVLKAQPRHLFTAPIIYSLMLPFALLDAMLWFYQQTCFRAYRIPLVKRGDYLVFDRHRLPYLNAVEKLNCLYCAYANGLIGYVREIAARTEQYWCPIKHARSRASEHERFVKFTEYGDADGYRRELPLLRRDLRRRTLQPGDTPQPKE